MEAMRYKSFIWPHNPRVYSIDFTRETAVMKFPMGAYSLQDLGRSCREMRGEGEFIGEGAYARFKELATVFYEGGPGLLIHPVWQCANAVLTQLKLRQIPQEDYVAYSFTFREEGSEAEALRTVSGTGGGIAGASYHIVRSGETFWSIAAAYQLSYEELCALNTQLRNPNLLLTGERVRVR